jgi:hypothetical protein
MYDLLYSIECKPPWHKTEFLTSHSGLNAVVYELRGLGSNPWIATLREKKGFER